MAQPAAQFVSPAFTKSAAGSARLHLALGEGGLHYAIRTAEGPIAAAVRYVNPDPDLKPYEFLDKVLFDDQLLKLSYGHVDLVSHAVRWTLAPDNLAAKADLLPLLQVHHEVNSTSDRLLTDVVRPGDIAVIYALTSMLVKRCDYYFKKYHLQHGVGLLIGESRRLHEALGQAYSVHVSLIEGRFYLLVTGPKGLLLANAYRAGAAEDVLYYVLSTLENLGIDPGQAAVTVTGLSSLRATADALLEAHLVGYRSAASFYLTQKDLSAAGWALDQLPLLGAAAVNA